MSLPIKHVVIRLHTTPTHRHPSDWQFSWFDSKRWDNKNITAKWRRVSKWRGSSFSGAKKMWSLFLRPETLDLTPDSCLIIIATLKAIRSINWIRRAACFFYLPNWQIVGQHSSRSTCCHIQMLCQRWVCKIFLLHHQICFLPQTWNWNITVNERVDKSDWQTMTDSLTTLLSYSSRSTYVHSKKEVNGLIGIVRILLGQQTYDRHSNGLTYSMH